MTCMYLNYILYIILIIISIIINNFSHITLKNRPRKLCSAVLKLVFVNVGGFSQIIHGAF